jgi:hypothetical protein
VIAGRFVTLLQTLDQTGVACMGIVRPAALASARNEDKSVRPYICLYICLSLN